MSAISRSWASLPAFDLFDDHRHARQSGALRRAPAPFACDDAVAAVNLPYHDRLDDAVRSDRLRELVEPRVFEAMARLMLVRRDLIDVNLGRRAAVRVLGHVRDERAEAFAERGSFFHRSPLLLHRSDATTLRDDSFCSLRRCVVAVSTESLARNSRARARYASAPLDFGS